MTFQASIDRAVYKGLSARFIFTVLYSYAPAAALCSRQPLRIPGGCPGIVIVFYRFLQPCLSGCCTQSPFLVV